MSSEVATEKTIVPAHQWTHRGNRVLLVKCVERGGKSHGGFQWPQSGPVVAEQFSREPDCESGGLFGWPWGLSLGGGKDPKYGGDWIVFSATPENVIDLGDKAKAVEECEVVYCGHWAGALAYTQAGRDAWIVQAAIGNTNTSGSGAASATGWSGAASATGWSGAASATGLRGAASATGEYGAASATGLRGAASATGLSGAASATGESGAACLTAFGTIEVGAQAAGVVTSEEFLWVTRPGAVLLHRWQCGHAVLLGEAHPDGTRVRVVRGEVVETLSQIQ